MADNKDKAQQDRQDLADQAGGNRQASSGAAQNSDFIHSTPEANVFPKGSSQSDNSGRSAGGNSGRSAGGNSGRSAGGNSAAGTPDEGRLGGTGGTSAAGTTGNDPDR
ncbi:MULTISPECIES: hypothetical protein [unclassified Massilia]|uniref:hypothetical protein n=1 Tax=unclassified Massilia TaxID=2609279 RepID=UPI000A933112|nr:MULTISPECIES: hypothetical protein [unclassified Massilia]